MSNNGKQIRSVNTAKDWLRILDKFPTELESQFQKVYGSAQEVIKERRNSIKRLAEKFETEYGNRNEMSIVRSPARVNLMGRHIDHQGGFVNTVAINKEILLAFSPSGDGIINIHNSDSQQFSSHELDPSSFLDITAYSDWISLTGSDEVKELNQKTQGDWSLYILAVYYRLQLHFSKQKLKGLDCFFSGNISVGSGLSSSSALGVAFAKALLQVNTIKISDKLLIELTGESELFLGFHGGKGDQAAIVSAKKGNVSKIGFFPLNIAENSPFPDNLKIVIAFSGLAAKKSGAIKNEYNQRVASYKIAFEILKQFKEIPDSTKYIRDLTPKNRQDTKNLLTAVAKLPKLPSRKDIVEIFNSEKYDMLSTLYTTHQDPGKYDLIGTVLFGLSECTRSKLFHEMLKSNDIDKIRATINASHNGDRLNTQPMNIDTLIEKDTPMTEIPGSYGCSTKDIDLMVDIANDVPGTIGAQIAGAGMGGNIVVLAERNVAEGVLTSLVKKYYQPKNITPDAHICVPISGASILGRPK